MTKEQNIMLDFLLTELRLNPRGDTGTDDEADAESVWIKKRDKEANRLRLTKEVVIILQDILVQDLLSTKNIRGHYTITPKGQLFNINEGYVTNSQKQQRLLCWQKVQMWTIAFATVVALLIFLLELQKYHSNCLCK